MRGCVLAVMIAACSLVGVSGMTGTPQHHHHHAAPHGGSLVELGTEAAHLELVVNRASGSLTLYVLDGEAEHAVRVASPSLTLHVERDGGAPVVVTLGPVANALTGETVGATSQFAAIHDVFRTSGPIRAVLDAIIVNGRTYRRVAIVAPAPRKGPRP